MTYGECCERLRANGPKINLADIPGIWFFYFLIDREVKTVLYHASLYEINFISCGHQFSAFPINELTCANVNDIHTILDYIIDNYYNKTPTFVKVDDEYYKIEVEVLETDDV